MEFSLLSYANVSEKETHSIRIRAFYFFCQPIWAFRRRHTEWSQLIEKLFSIIDDFISPNEQCAEKKGPIHQKEIGRERTDVCYESISFIICLFLSLFNITLQKYHAVACAKPHTVLFVQMIGVDLIVFLFFLRHDRFYSERLW